MPRITFVRSLASLTLATALALGSTGAFGWTEARPAGLVTEVAVAPDGGAEVTLRIRWRVLAGRLHQFDLTDLPVDLTVLEASAINASGTTVPLRTAVPSPGRLELSLGDEGVRRGTVDVVVRYTTSLRATGAIQRAGADAVLEVSTAPWERALEAAEVRITVPASARRAQWITDETPGVDTQTTTELSRDVVHALRRHLPPHTRWTARIAMDPNAFPWLAGRAATGPRPTRIEGRPWRETSLAGLGLAALFVLLGVTVARRSGPAALPLARGAQWLPVVLLGLGGAVQSLLLRDVPFALPASVLLLVLALAARLPRRADVALADPRTPARWIDARAVNALDLGTTRKPWAAGLSIILGGLALGAWALSGSSLLAGVAAIDLGLLGIAVIALRASSRPNDFAALRPLARTLAGALPEDARARIAWRLRGAPASLGALRLRVVPRRGWRLARGVVVIELGCAWRRGTLAWHPRPYARLRIAEGSTLEAPLRELAAQAGTLTREADRPVLAYTVGLVGVDRAAFFTALRNLGPTLIVRAPGQATRSQLGAADTASLTAPIA